MWDFAFFRNATAGGQLPGLGANELNVSQQAVVRAAEAVSLLEEVVRQLHAAHHAAMLEGLSALEALLVTETQKGTDEAQRSAMPTDTYYRNFP